MKVRILFRENEDTSPPNSNPSYPNRKRNKLNYKLMTFQGGQNSTKAEGFKKRLSGGNQQN